MKPCETSSSPAEIVGSIDDLLTEFFKRIPLKPLFKLKLVSKRWNSLISDPKLHSSRNKKPVGFIFQISDPTVDLGKETAYVLSLDRSSPIGPPSITELDFAEDQLHISDEEYGVGNKICHSCNGLLVGYLCEYTENTWDSDIKDYFVYNPTTREYKSVPRRRGLGFIQWMYLAFDPSKSPHYKIVCVLSLPPYRTELSQFKFAVYSSKTRSWKKYDNKFSSKFEFENGVYWNGSIHWISISKTMDSIYFSPPDHDDNHDDDDDDDDNDDDDDGDNDDDEDDYYDDDDYSYDDDDGDSGHHLKVLVMPTPPMLEDEANIYFGESCDHLNFISYYGRDDEYKLKVYEMRRDYSEWFVKYCVDVSNVWSRGLGNFDCPKSFAVCGLVRGKKSDDDSFLVLLIERRMVVYNVVRGTFEITSEFEEDDYDHEYEIFRACMSEFKHSTGSSFDCPLQYIESLCLV